MAVKRVTNLLAYMVCDYSTTQFSWLLDSSDVLNSVWAQGLGILDSASPGSTSPSIAVPLLTPWRNFLPPYPSGELATPFHSHSPLDVDHILYLHIGYDWAMYPTTLSSFKAPVLSVCTTVY